MTNMKNAILIFLSVIPASVYCMQEPISGSDNILHLAKAQIGLNINHELLDIAYEYNPDTRLRRIKDYYEEHPRNIIDYLSDPICNLKKVGAFLQLARVASIKLRQEAAHNLKDNPAELEMVPLDTQILPWVKKEWPVVSVAYDLKQMNNELNAIYSWVDSHTSLQSHNNPRVQEFLKQIKRDHEATQRTIQSCLKKEQ